MQCPPTTTTDDDDDDYITLVPRGLYEVFRECLQETFFHHHHERGRIQHNHHHQQHYKLDVTVVGEERTTQETHRYMDHLVALQQQQQQKRPAQRKHKNESSWCGNLPQQQQHDDASRHGHPQQHLMMPTGSIRDPDVNKHKSIGYHNYNCGTHPTTNHATKASIPRRILSYGGDASVWVRFTTNAPPDFVANHVRCVGPLLATVRILERNHHGGTAWVDPSCQSSLRQVAQQIQRQILQDESLDSTQQSYTCLFERALHLWKQHVRHSWNLSRTEQEDLDCKLKNQMNTACTADAATAAPLQYRVGCLRYNSRDYSYSRQALIVSLVDTIVPTKFSKRWRVNLIKYDVEVVLLVQSHCVAVGLALRPYQRLGTKSWAQGVVPPDVTPPQLSSLSNANSNNSGVDGVGQMVRLRPTTAKLLLHMAKIRKGDVVLDPCAGVGTIPVVVGDETYALGGDVVLTPDGLGSLGASYVRQARVDSRGGSSRADLAAWDATCLPLRTNSVDVVVSDLPFGQQCLSSNKLSALLPLLLGEVGRVLRPNSGRMVMLCGSFSSLVAAMEQLNQVQPDTWELPCQSIFPVNIGGLVAWVVVANRGRAQGKRVPNHAERARKVAEKRQHINKHREWQAQQAVKDGRSKIRRVQE